MINFRNIPSNELDELIKELDEKISYVQSEFGIELKSYGNILRIAINGIQKETFENLIERLSINRELERALDNAGGYTVDFLEDNNPKENLLNILKYLSENTSKQLAILKYLNETEKRIVAVFDNNDIDFVKPKIRNKKIEVISYSDLKRTDLKNKTLVLHTFNGQKDFEYLYNLDNEIRLVVYKQEKNLYYKYLDQRKKIIEQ